MLTPPRWLPSPSRHRVLAKPVSDWKASRGCCRRISLRRNYARRSLASGWNSTQRCSPGSSGFCQTDRWLSSWRAHWRPAACGVRICGTSPRRSTSRHGQRRLDSLPWPVRNGKSLQHSGSRSEPAGRLWIPASATANRRRSGRSASVPLPAPRRAAPARAAPIMRTVGTRSNLSTKPGQIQVVQAGTVRIIRNSDLRISNEQGSVYIGWIAVLSATPPMRVAHTRHASFPRTADPGRPPLSPVRPSRQLPAATHRWVTCTTAAGRGGAHQRRYGMTHPTGYDYPALQGVALARRERGEGSALDSVLSYSHLI